MGVNLNLNLNLNLSLTHNPHRNPPPPPPPPPLSSDMNVPAVPPLWKASKAKIDVKALVRQGANMGRQPLFVEEVRQRIY